MRLPAILPYACSVCSADFDDWVALNTTTVFAGRYALSICSADFNDWIAKTTSTSFVGSYLFTGEWEMPEWNLGNTVRTNHPLALLQHSSQTHSTATKTTA